MQNKANKWQLKPCSLNLALRVYFTQCQEKWSKKAQKTNFYKEIIFHYDIFLGTGLGNRIGASSTSYQCSRGDANTTSVVRTLYL